MAELQIEPSAADRIDRLVASYVRSICALDTGDAEYQRTIATVERLGEREFVATAAMSGRLLDRRFHAMSGLLTSRAPMARRLGDLRKAVAELDPSRLKLGGTRSVRQQLDELIRYFERFWRAQSRIEETLAALTEGRMMLEQDNAEIEQEERLLATEMESLRQYAFLAGRLDDALAAAIDSFAAAEPDRAAALRADVLYAVRRRRQSILTELAVATQGYAALRIVEQNNHEVIRAVAEATNTTAAAMRTAVMVAQAAASQRATLEQLDMAGEATQAMADQAAEMEAQLPDSRARVGMLQQAWAEVSAALDRVDAHKAEALRTISSTDRELTHSRTDVGNNSRELSSDD
ncbi:MAG TPA: toxic anion resistance protein [Candidatus Limnocylindrales bacterium]